MYATIGQACKFISYADLMLQHRISGCSHTEQPYWKIQPAPAAHAGYFKSVASPQDAGLTHIDTSRNPPRPPPRESNDITQQEAQHIVVGANGLLMDVQALLCLH